ncbi:MAG: response regulator, partial [Merismopedia sp. SIO2A8]|nr:response regulator [Merismopedia sp. SIO2A8]
NNNGDFAVIISDQRMPEMKGTEFLSKTVPQFPNTIRIILTGFTDVEDLVDAINSGQVYKYITKPWDPKELKEVVSQATKTYSLLRQRTDELSRAQVQASLLKALVDIPCNATTLGECLKQLAVVFGESLHANQCRLQMVTDGTLFDDYGCYNAPGIPEQPLAGDPLVKDAIATQSIKLFVHSSARTDYSEYYLDGAIGTHLAIPLISKESPFALLSLQWAKDFWLESDDISILHLLSNQLALSLACLELP